MKLATLATLNAERNARRIAVVVTEIATGRQRLVKGADIAADALREPIEDRVSLRKSGLVIHQGAEYFLTVSVPPVKAVVIGAVHVSQALAPMAKLAGVDMTIVDPRTAFASKQRFPDVPLLAEWPDQALPKLGLDPHTALIALTHDPKIDDPALVAALKARCFYVGALGSRKTHAGRVERLKAHGFDEATIARIKAPIGLDIGAVSPAEIAVSVLGELIAEQHKKPTRAAKAAGAAP